MSLNLIVAHDKNKVIGNGLNIPWDIKGEQKLFKELTENNIVIMGRKTYESIGKKLPDRINIVIPGCYLLVLNSCYKISIVCRNAAKSSHKYFSDKCRG